MIGCVMMLFFSAMNFSSRMLQLMHMHPLPWVLRQIIGFGLHNVHLCSQCLLSNVAIHEHVSIILDVAYVRCLNRFITLHFAMETHVSTVLDFATKSLRWFAQCARLQSIVHFENAIHEHVRIILDAAQQVICVVLKNVHVCNQFVNFKIASNDKQYYDPSVCNQCFIENNDTTNSRFLKFVVFLYWGLRRHNVNI